MKYMTSWRVERQKRANKMQETVLMTMTDGDMFAACNGCGEDHDPEDCTHGFNGDNTLIDTMKVIAENDKKHWINHLENCNGCAMCEYDQ